MRFGVEIDMGCLAEVSKNVVELDEILVVATRLSLADAFVRGTVISEFPSRWLG